MEAFNQLLRMEIAAGHLTQARDLLARLAELATRTGSGAAEVARLCGSAALEQDLNAAEAAVALAKERGSTFELATACLQAGRIGLRRNELIPIAYEHFGALGALVWRVRTRKLIRSGDQRDSASGEHDHLLALAVADGLSNRELAHVFACTPKSVEAQLTRLFAKVGLRSRVELAASARSGALKAQLAGQPC